MKLVRKIVCSLTACGIAILNTDFFETPENLLKIKRNYEKLILNELGFNVFCVETVEKKQSTVVQNIMQIIQEKFSL